jgi:nicotinamidase-related amidase
MDILRPAYHRLLWDILYDIKKEGVMQNSNEAALTIDPAKTALILLHWQNDIASPGFKHARNHPERLAAAHTLEHAQAVLEASREKGVLVVYVNGGHRPGYPDVGNRRVPMFQSVVGDSSCIRGSKGAEVVDRLKPQEGDIIVFNYSPDGFCYTDLDLILRNKGITDLVLSGFSTNWAVETTAREGASRGYFVYTLEDCCNSTTDEMHNWSITNILPRLGAVIDSKAYLVALSRV